MISSYFEGKLPPDERARVTAHIAECDRCAKDFKGIVEALVHIFEQTPEGAEPAEGSSPQAQHFEWVDSKRLRTLVPGGESADSKVLWPSSLLVQAAAMREIPAARGRARRVQPALLVAGVALVFGAMLSSHVPTREPEVALASIARAERLVSPRFTGGLPWAPLETQWPHRADEQYLEPGAARYVAAAERRRGASDGPTGAELGALGAVYALGGRAESGVETLRRAAAAEPDSAELLSDLGAALLARAEIGDRRRLQEPAAELADHDADLPAALEAIDRALEISPRLREALFNRALALERLYLRRSARGAWEAYLDVDGGSPWAREAQSRMAAIVIPTRPDPARIRAEIAAVAAGGDRERLAELVGSHRHLTRASVQEDLLPRWAEAWLSGELPEAERQLATASTVADEWEAQTTDATLSAAVAEVEGASRGARGRLAEGYRALGEASRALAGFELDAAQAAAERSLRVLPRKSPAVTWAALVRLACIGYRGGNAEAEASRIARDSGNDLASVGRLYWIAGVLHARSGKLTTALAEYRQSLAAYSRLDENESAVALHHVIGEVYCHMGALGACWQHRRVALESAATLTDRDRGMSILRFSAMLALFEGEPRAATDFLAEALAAPDLEEPGQIAWTHLWRGRVLHELGRRHEALQDLERAAAWAPGAKPFERKNLSADLDFASGLVVREPERAVEHFSRAFARFRSLGFHWRLPGVLLARARAHLEMGDEAAADRDLSQGLALLDEQGSDLVDQLSPARLDGPDELFDERVQLAFSQGHDDEAFATAEAARDRRLRKLLPAGEARGPAARPAPLRPAEVAARLDADTTLLVYSWLPGGVRVWRIDQADSTVLSVGAAPRQVAELVSALTADLEAGAWTAATRETAMRLYSDLVGGVKPSSRRLVVVPDDVLHAVPFGALVNPESGRFLIEERELVIAPSASAFLESQARRAAYPATPADALVVGDPRTDPAVFPGIRSLPGARAEARAVASLYPRRELLLGEAATRTAFLGAVGRRDVVHFAGHAVANRVDPERSSLPLAEEQGRSGLLVAADIARLDLTGTHTVVLSGCETGVGGDGGGEGPLSLARAFLVAGVPNVVASLWPIADVPSAPLMTAFHARLRNGEPPATALRAAQLGMLRGREQAQRSPSVWAAFEAFGG